MECDVIVFISFSNVAKVKFFLIRNEELGIRNYFLLL